MAAQSEIICPWDGWTLVKLLGRGTYGRVYLYKRVEYGITFYSAIKHISIPADLNQIDDLSADGTSTDAVTMKVHCTQLLQSFMNEINVWKCFVECFTL